MHPRTAQAFFIMSKDKPSYYAILTANVRYDNNLKAIEKLLFAEITALSNKHGRCWSTNAYFAELYNVSKTSISKYISNLQKQGYINTVLIYKEDSKQIDKRYIYINNTPIEQTLNTPIVHTLKDNTTSNNITRESKKAPSQDNDLPKQPEDWVQIANGWRPPHASDKYKGQEDNNPRNLSHTEFIKEYAASSYEQKIKMRYSHRIKDKDSFIRKFNNKCVYNDVPFVAAKILAQMDSFAITWINKQNKQL